MFLKYGFVKSIYNVYIKFKSVGKLEMINLEVFNIGFGKITTHSCRAELAPVD